MIIQGYPVEEINPQKSPFTAFYSKNVYTPGNNLD